VSFVRSLRQGYKRLLLMVLERSTLASVGLISILILASLVVKGFGEEFLPRFHEYNFLIHWVEKPGTSLQAMRRITARVSRELRAVPGVQSFGSHIGRAENADEIVGPNFAELWVSLNPRAHYDEAIAKIQEISGGYAGLNTDLLTYLNERIDEV